MKRYKITFDLSKDQFVDFFLDKIGSMLALSKIEVHDDQNQDKLGAEIPIRRPKEALAPRQRARRSSKVNHAILGKLREGHAHKTDLEAALVEVGCKASSLSTGLSLLQKGGQVKRLGDGMYGLAEAGAEAA